MTLIFIAKFHKLDFNPIISYVFLEPTFRQESISAPRISEEIAFLSYRPQIETMYKNVNVKKSVHRSLNGTVSQFLFRTHKISKGLILTNFSKFAKLNVREIPENLHKKIKQYSQVFISYFV